MVCGWEPRRKQSETSWYALCAAGLAQLGATNHPFEGGWEGEYLVIEAQPESVSHTPRESASALPAPMPALFGTAPGWHALPAPHEAPLTRPLAPSRPENASYGAAPPALSPLQIAAGQESGRRRALDRGTLVHRLLQWLPDRDEADWRFLAEDFLAQPAHGLAPEEIERLVTQVLAVLKDETLAPLFAPGSLAEQPITGLAFGQVVLGQVDRLRVTENCVMLCDFKTNQYPPRPGQAVPAAYQRQMAAYGAVLRQLYPDRELVMALVWTEGPTISLVETEQ